MRVSCTPSIVSSKTKKLIRTFLHPRGLGKTPKNPITMVIWTVKMKIWTTLNNMQ